MSYSMGGDHIGWVKTWIPKCAKTIIPLVAGCSICLLYINGCDIGHPSKKVKSKSNTFFLKDGISHFRQFLSHWFMLKCYFRFWSVIQAETSWLTAENDSWLTHDWLMIGRVPVTKPGLHPLISKRCHQQDESVRIQEILALLLYRKRKWASVVHLKSMALILNLNKPPMHFCSSRTLGSGLI